MPRASLVGRGTWSTSPARLKFRQSATTNVSGHAAQRSHGNGRTLHRTAARDGAPEIPGDTGAARVPPAARRRGAGASGVRHRTAARGLLLDPAADRVAVARRPDPVLDGLGVPGHRRRVLRPAGLGDGDVVGARAPRRAVAAPAPRRRSRPARRRAAADLPVVGRHLRRGVSCLAGPCSPPPLDAGAAAVVSPRRRLTDYYRQFEALSPEENAARLVAQRRAEQAAAIELTPDLDLATTAFHEPPDPEVVNAATFALRRRINTYPETGPGAAVRAIAAHHGVPAERVALGHGAGQLLQAALRELAAGGEAVLPWPTWSPLPALARRAGVQPVPVAMEGDIDLDALSGAINDRTRAVVICSPNDPTGALVDREALRSFAAGLPPEVSVLLDEALVEFAGEQASAVGLVGELENLIVFRSFSKAWSMAGLRA